MLFRKYYSRINSFGIQNKNNFHFYFQTWKNRKTEGAIGPKVLKKLSSAQANQISIKVLPTAKDPKNYENNNNKKITNSNWYENEWKQAGKANDGFCQPFNRWKCYSKTSRKKKNIRETIKWKHYKNEKNERLLINYKISLFFFYLTKFYRKNMSYIQLPYGYVKNNKQVQFSLP